MKISAIDGRSGFCKDAAAELTIETAVFAGGFGFITAKGAASYFDTLVDSSPNRGKSPDSRSSREATSLDDHRRQSFGSRRYSHAFSAWIFRAGPLTAQ